MDLYYREYGTGFPVVILHGLYGSSDNWVSVANELADKYRVILPDQRNHGRSPHHESHTYREMSEDLYRLVTSLGINNFILAGHSMGGKTAAFFAMQWPHLLEGLLILDISPFKVIPDNIEGSVHYGILKKLKEIDPSTLKNREEADSLLSDTIPSVKVRNFLLKNLQRDTNGKFEWKLNPQFLFDNIHNIYDGLERPGQAESSNLRGFPVFFLRAMDSDYITDNDYEPINKLFPAAEVIEVADTSHWIHAEKPEVIIKLIRDQFPV